MGNFISYGDTNCRKNRTQNQPILLGRFATLALQTIWRKKENIYFPSKKRLNLTQTDRAKAQEIRYSKVRYLASASVISPLPSSSDTDTSPSSGFLSPHSLVQSLFAQEVLPISTDPKIQSSNCHLRLNR